MSAYANNFRPETQVPFAPYTAAGDSRHTGVPWPPGSPPANSNCPTRACYSWRMPERESLEIDVLVVGGGPAGLAAAYHLRQLNKDLSIAVLEKGKEIGAHIISGAVMDPRGINDLMPDWKKKGAPVEKAVDEDHVLFLTKRSEERRVGKECACR